MLADQLIKWIKNKELWQPQERILVAVSTGVDSMVLLHILEQMDLDLGVVYVNHRLRTASDKEEMFLTDYCQKHNLPLYKTKWQTPAEKGVEAAAREFRYAFFEQTMRVQAYDVLVTAHHADDQMETILMKLVREGNFFSSSGIRLTQPFGNGRLIRPLLATTKEEIIEYSQSQQINYYEDETNASLEMQRNRLRHQVLPLLKKENVKANQHFQQWAQQMFWAQEIIHEQQELWYQKSLTQTEMSIEIAVPEYLNLTEAQRYFYLSGISQRKLPVALSEKQIQQLMELLVKDVAQWQIDLSEEWVARKSYQRLVFQKKRVTAEAGKQSYQLSLGESFYLSATEWVGLFLVGTEKIPEKVKLWSEYRQELSLECLNGICLRKRQPGDRIALTPNLTKKIRRFFIDEKIANEAREKSWVVTDEAGKILGLLPYAFSYLSITKETDKIHYVLLYRRKNEWNT